MSWTTDLDPRLASAAEELEATRSAAEVYDPEWRLVYLTSEFRSFAGGKSLEELGVGRHVVSIRAAELHGMVPPEVSLRWLRTNIPLMAHDTPGGADAIRAMLPDAEARALGPFEPQEPRTLWWGELTYLQPGLPPAQTRYVTFALTEPDGGRIGWAIVYLPAAPASIVSLITRGNQGMFARMAELLHPARHETAILFADIQASSQLARRLSSQRWFELIRDFSTEADNAAISRTGIVGRHAGDGMTAFFLAEQAGSRAAACAAALEAGREIVEWSPPGMERGEVKINAGVHWGGALYLGQVVTGGRLEVTALGDEVNECARIQQSARDGVLLASKPLVERLDHEHAQASGLDPLTITYRTVGELPGVTPKAVRDAGGVPVVAVPRRAQPAR
ncbi:MAG TPA: adenylate/guanylate cyclase domain-containing protein [Solirubrobacteraceae bacterium]|nr:adenylate/guanylate cyclase domain-containing protein [Solirubrobacteraceae bacterium]